MAFGLSVSAPASAQTSPDEQGDTRQDDAPAPVVDKVPPAQAAPLSSRLVWEYVLLGTAIAGVATGVTLVTVNHARVNDYNLGVQNYNQGVNNTAGTREALANLRSSINTGERWGYIVGGIGLAAAAGVAFLYVTDAEPTAPSGGVALGLGSLTVYGYF